MREKKIKEREREENRSQGMLEEMISEEGIGKGGIKVDEW